MANTVNGPTPAIPNTSSYQTSDGNLNQTKLTPQGTPAAFDNAVSATPTATAAQILGGLITSTGTVALTLPLATDLDTALPNAFVGDSFDFSVISIGANTCTVTTNTGWTLVGTMTVLTTIASGFRARKTGTGTWTLYRMS